MSHTIRISDETYEHIITEAAKSGVEPEVWAETKLKPVKKKKVSERARRKAWNNYIGSFDSSKSDAMADIDPDLPYAKKLDKVFGKILEEKFSKQGLKLDK